MPCYNCEKYIDETIQSVLNQTYDNWEIICVDDCSTDKTDKIIKEYSKKNNKIKYIKLEKNSGAAVARQKGIEISKGEYIAFLDSDDIWLPEKLSKQILYMEKEKKVFTCTAYAKYKNNELLKVVTPPEKADYNSVIKECLVGNSTVIYKKEFFDKLELPNIKKRNDLALWLTMLKKTDYIFGMKEVLMNYRVRTDSLSSNKLTLIKYHWTLYRKIEKHSLIKSIYLLLNWAIVKTLNS